MAKGDFFAFVIGPGIVVVAAAIIVVSPIAGWRRDQGANGGRFKQIATDWAAHISRNINRDLS